MKWGLIIIGLIATISVGLLFITDENITFETFKPRQFNSIIEPSTLIPQEDNLLIQKHDRLNFKFDETGVVTVLNEHNNKLGEVDLYIEVGILGYTTDEYNWNWSNYSYIDLIEWGIDFETNETIYKNFTVNVWTGYNNDIFNWTQVWIFHGNKNAKVKHFITNNAPSLTNDVEYFYRNSIDNGVEPIYKPQNNAIDFGGYEFRYGDLLSNNFSINTAPSLTASEDYVIGLTTVNQFGNGNTIELDPEITDWKLPTETGIHIDEWADGVNLKLKDGNLAIEGTLTHKESTSFFNMPPSEADLIVHGIEVRIGGSKLERSLCDEIGIQVDLSSDNGTTWSNNYSNVFSVIGTVDKTYGGLSDLWGISWDGDSISDDNFIARINHHYDKGIVCTARADQVEVRMNISEIFGEPPIVTLWSPADKIIVNDNNITLDILLQDVEKNLVELFVYSCSNKTKLKECLLYREKDIDTGGASVHRLYNFSHPISWAEDDSYWGIYHLDNLEEYGEDVDNIRDFSNRGVNSTIMFNGPFPLPYGGILGGAWEFNGDDTVVRPGDIDGTEWKDVCNNGCTFSAWVYVKGTATKYFLGRWSDTGDEDNEFFKLGVSGKNSNRSIFLITENGNNSYCTSQSSNNAFPTRNQWNHIVGVWDTSTNEAKTYVNGELKSTQACPFDDIDVTAWQDNQPFNIGADDEAASASFWNGTLDEVVIWNRTLTDCEVKKLYSLNPRETYYWTANATDSNSSSQPSSRSLNISSCQYLCDDWNVETNCEITENIIIDDGFDCICSGGNIWTILGANITGWDRFIVRNGCKVHLMRGAHVVP